MARRKKNQVGRSVYRALATISQFGINMLVPIAMMSILGYWLDKKLGTSWIFIVLFFVGAIAGFQNVFRLAMKIGTDKEDAEDATSKKD